ncbi:hypothetical protein THRCLA_02358 [Thraustotheca clavata]|uniref:Uncharacterized protein n=1 Tax=Thraustotheca clavata TaxID=74557 RepID=A0A1W0A5P2_9STRA|nr:hypothetical protein THRCLA_02358 [Thraustotheca clavata]
MTLLSHSFRSIDIFFIAPPTDFIDTVLALDSFLLSALQSNASIYSAFQELTKTTLDSIPKTWRQFDYEYFGGSPMCNIRPATNFVQTSFAFDDTCGQPKQMQITITPQSAPFAYTLLCTTNISSLDICDLYFIYNGLILNTAIPESILAWAPNATLNDVEIIQFAQLNSTSVILRQHLLHNEWPFFGYVGVYEWVYDHREVISFERDTGIFVVLSEPLE